MALYRFKETGDGAELNWFRTSDTEIVNFVTSRQDLYRGNIIGQGKNKMKIDSISIEVFGKPKMDEFSEIGKRYPVDCEVLFDVTPLNKDEFQLWDKDFWNDITENGYAE